MRPSTRSDRAASDSPDALVELARAYSFAHDAGHGATSWAIAKDLAPRLGRAGHSSSDTALVAGRKAFWAARSGDGRSWALAYEPVLDATWPPLRRIARPAMLVLAVAALAGALPAPGCVPPGPVTPPPVVVTPPPGPGKAPDVAVVRAAVRVHLARFVTTHRNLASQIRDEKGPQTNDQIIAAVATARAATGTRLGQVVDQAIRPLCNADGTFRDRAGVAAVLDAVADGAARP